MTTIDEYLETARSRLNRVAPEDLETAMARGALVVDIRPEASRVAEGEMPGAIVIERNVLDSLPRANGDRSRWPPASR
jgi:rhodanese-related sulfurtransferase